MQSGLGVAIVLGKPRAHPDVWNPLYMTAPKKPDHTGVFITPACFFVAAAILSGILISKAVQFAGGDDTPGRYYGTLKRGLGEMIESLARSLGVAGSVGLSAALLLASGVWLLMAFRRYRALTAG